MLIENQNYEVAVLIPALDEEKTISTVVAQFKQKLPDAAIYVYDNDSSDNTLKLASQTGAITRVIRHKGKGNVIYRMFADIEADIYVLIDADNTYNVAEVDILIKTLVKDKCDMVVGTRQPQSEGSYPSGHEFGNRMFNKTLSWLFNESVSDMLSGYRVLSRRYVKTIPLSSTGFEIETEMTVYTLQTRLPFKEIPIRYQQRPTGSMSKLRTVRDGQRIARKIISMVESERPLFFYGSLSCLFALISVILAIPLFVTFFETGLVPRFPTAIMCASLMVIALIMFVCGLLGRSILNLKREVRRLLYLSYNQHNSH